MVRFLTTLILVGVAIQADRSISPTNRSVNPVVQWNRNLLSIVRTPGAQPATIHPTRSFAIMHAAIYDAVNAIDRTHALYLVASRRFARPHQTPPQLQRRTTFSWPVSGVQADSSTPNCSNRWRTSLVARGQTEGILDRTSGG